MGFIPPSPDQDLISEFSKKRDLDKKSKNIYCHSYPLWTFATPVFKGLREPGYKTLHWILFLIGRWTWNPEPNLSWTPRLCLQTDNRSVCLGGMFKHALFISIVVSFFVYIGPGRCYWVSSHGCDMAFIYLIDVFTTDLWSRSRNVLLMLEVCMISSPFVVSVMCEYTGLHLMASILFSSLDDFK